ncbi:hypothetical protein AMJ71_01860 [candidate division TA06 bacterium SM1_40]|uniref:POTRA domain-containing protein n=1 Tax=candidate division TA06 bacterium SM1_40 TaxID=1703773 RepID=A0A0S8JPV4_UNCT6|nr:MAG: hypothetical protein AMJ71_01860 [candidate division TA06 bacterium SM1_40]
MLPTMSSKNRCVTAFLAVLILVSSGTVRVATSQSLSSGGVTQRLFGKISFQGNEAFSDDLLRKEMRIRRGAVFRRSILERGILKVTSFYHNRGYLDAKVIGTRGEMADERHIDYLITVDEGARSFVEEVQVSGNAVMSTGDLVRYLDLKKDDPLDKAKLEASEDGILAAYADAGYVYAELETTTLPGERARHMIVQFRIEEGPRAYIGDIEITGNERVRSAIIGRELVIHRGDLYRPRQVLESQRRIYATGLFRDVRFVMSGLTEMADTVDVFIEVTEDRLNWIGVGFGYLSPDRIRAALDWGHENLFDNAQRLVLSVSGAFNVKGEWEAEYAADYLEPRLFSSGFQGGIRTYYDHEKRVIRVPWRVSRFGVNVQVGRFVGPGTRLSLGYGYRSVRYRVAHPENLPAENREELEGGVTNSMAAMLLRDVRNDIFDPSDGSLISGGIEVAGGLLGGDHDFWRVPAEAKFYAEPRWSPVWAIRGRCGYVRNYGRSGAVPREEQFELGGESSVRGYDEASIGPENPLGERRGSVMANVNVEARIPLFWRFGGVAFIDGGGVWRNVSDVDPADLGFGAGIGLRYRTAIGPLRLDYGRKLTERRSGDHGRVYLGIGHIF